MMERLVTNVAGTAAVRDPRYASLWELSGPQNGLSLLSAAFVEVDAGATSPHHYHDKTEEIYMIVEGSGIMHLGDQSLPVSSGDCVTIPVCIVHAIGNTGTAPLRMWVVTSPPYTEDDDFEIEGQGND